MLGGSGIKITACTGRVSQEKRSVFLKVMVVVIVTKKKVHVNVCLILNGYRNIAVCISRRIALRFLCMRMDEG